MNYTFNDLPTINARRTFTNRLDLLRNEFVELANNGTKKMKAATVRSIAESFRFNYATGKIAAKRAGITVC